MDYQEILRALQDGRIDPDEAKNEIMKRSKVSGVALHSSLSSKSHTQSGGSHQTPSALGDGYGLVLDTVRDLNELSLQPWSVQKPLQGEISLKVKASAINFPDTMCVKGLYPTMPEYPFVPGFEVSGVVTAVGEGVNEFHVGDEIIALTGQQMGGHASQVNVPAMNAVRKPHNISFEEACSLPVVFATVYHAFKIGNLGPREHVLIQTATGGCGLIAIQLARLQGCICYGTSSKPEKLDILNRLYVPYALNYKTSPFDLEIKRMTEGRGVDVVLNMLSGDAIQKGLNCLAPSGRYLELAVHALKTSAKLDLSKLVRNQSIYSIDLRQIGAGPGFHKEILETLVAMVESEQIVPIVSRIYPLNRIKEALEFVGSGQHIGKVVISHESNEIHDHTELLIRRMLKQKERSESRSPTVTAESLSPKLPVAPLNGREEGVAIIGMSGQFPKSGTLSEFWENIAQGRDCVSEIPAERWPLNKYYDPDPKAPGKTYCRWMGALDDVDKFDPLFFNISPIEAELMDPQQRLFLENSWKCIEDAGISPASMSGSRCGVFVGCGAGDYGRSMGSETMNAQGLMGGAPSILSARISYLLNLKGPCLAIDTACSSSLVAIAEACNSLILRTSDMALAGGVNVMSGPTMHVMTSKAGMLSKDGRCFTFDDRANGFVPGEGVGVLLLKRLSDAVRDQDPIYGVIRGWAINQDGKTNGITAPSAQSQTALEKEVYERFHIDPETITLIEAHGTGTKLGDPIEVEALTESFRSFTQKTNYCALGSVKSNIGHLLAASGVSGVIKTLLALKYRMLPPTVHFQSLNEHILLEQSPFYVNTELKPWHTEEGGPRRAGVSSFGFSGTNAHVVIEEYISDSSSNELPSVAGKPCSPHLFPLSAKNEEQLRVYAHDMQNFLKNNAGLNLADAAYTLQTGREAMDCRLAIIADSLQSLCDALCAFADGSPAEGTLTGQIRKRKEGRVVLAVDTELVRGWFRTGKLDQVADSWCKGMMTDWAELYEGRKPCRVHLPAYPFAKERHWLSETQSKAVQASEFRLDAGSLHPLIHTNVSDNSGLHYRTSFTGKEFFFTDHVVGGHRTMPGAAFLEMARESAVQAAGTSGERPGIVRIRNTVWLRPIVAAADVGVNVRVSLTSSDDGEIVYKVSSSSGEKRAEPTLHGQGTVALLSAAGQPDQWDIQSILADCTLYKLSSGDCYQAFEAMGIRYGPAHQGLTEVHVGEGQLLARLSLPDCVFGTFESYVLHPSMLDSALQSAIGFIWSSVDAKGSSGDDRPKPYLPFALDELEIYAACQPSMWASVRIRADEGSHSGKIQRLDIDLCDENGKVCVRIKGFSTRSSVGGNIEATEKGTGDSVDPAASMTGSTALVPVWDTAVPAMSISDERREGVVIFGGEAAEQAVLLQRYPHAKVLDMSLSGAIEDFEASVSRCGSVEHIVWIAPHHQPFAPVEEALLETQNGSVLQLFRLVKALLRLDYGSRNITWSVITKNAQAIRKQDRPNSAHAGIHGFIGSMAKEHPCWSVRLIDLEVNAAWPVEQMFRLPPDPQGDAWGYRQGEWFRQTLIPCQISSASPSAYRHGGVYVVIGGAGGIGEVWSEYMIRNYRARVVWLGRRPADDSIRTRIGRLAALGPAPEYVRADAADRGSLEQAYETVKKKFGAIHGVVHSAIVLLDQSLAHMEEERFQAGMAAKTDVSVRIAQVFERETLDFILFFSSFNSMLKSAGQSNYTAGCTFKDAFAAQLSRERSCKIKVINWGYWGSVGSVATRRYQERMARVGLGSIEPEEAMAVLESLLTGPVDQLALLKATMPNVMGSLVSGDSLRIYPSKAESVAERMMQRLAVGCDSSECSKQIADLDLACSDKQGAPGHILENLLHIAADILKVEQADIDTEAAWRECGFDPLTLACLADELSRTYNMDINAEMIQERMTLSSIAEFVSEKGKYVP